MQEIGVIVNTTSGRNKKGKFRRKRISGIFGSSAIVVRTSTISELPDVIRRFRDAGISLLCIDGGDGTIQKVLTEWIDQEQDENSLPIILPLRGGTSNATALDFGIRGESEDISRKVIAEFKRYRQGLSESLPTFPRNLLRVNASFHSRTEYGFILANGIVYQGVKLFQQKKDRTIRTAFMVVAEIVTAALLHGQDTDGLFQMFPATLTIDGREYPSRYYTGMLASALDRLLFKIAPFYPENLTKTGFNFAGLSIPAWEAVKHAYDLFRGRRSPHLPPELFINDRIRSLSIESCMGFMLDGELYSADGKNNLLTVSHGPMVRVLKLPDFHLSEQLRRFTKALSSNPGDPSCEDPD